MGARRVRIILDSARPRGGPLAQDRAFALRALYGVEQEFSPDDLHRWLSFKERVGEDIAAGVAWSGLATLARCAVPDACRNVLRSVLGQRWPKDVRAGLREKSYPLDRLLRDQAGLGLGPFFSRWRQELGEARRALAAELAALPRLRGQVVFDSLSAVSRKVEYRVTIDRPPAPATHYAFLYHLLPAFDEEVDPKLIRREQNDYPERPGGELPETYDCGARLYSTFSLEVPALGCPVISGWTRREIR